MYNFLKIYFDEKVAKKWDDNEVKIMRYKKVDNFDLQIMPISVV